MAPKKRGVKGHRVALTLNEETNAVFDRLAELSDTPKATVIRDYLEQILPSVKQTVEVLESYKSNQMTAVEAQYSFLNFLAGHNDTMSQLLREIAKPLVDEES